MELVIQLHQDGRMELKIPQLPLPMIIGILELAKGMLLTGPPEEQRVELASTLPFTPKKIS